MPERIAQSTIARKKDEEGNEALSPQDSRLRLVEPPPGASTVAAQIRELEREIRGGPQRPASDLLADWVHRLRVLADADGAVVAMRDAKGIVCHASSGRAPEVGSRLQPDSSLTRECFENGHVVICEDVESDPRIPSPIARTLDLRSALIVPIKANESVLGVVEVLSSRPFAFNADTVAAMQAVAVPLARLLCPKPASRALNSRLWLVLAVLIACLLLLFIALRVYRSTSNSRRAVVAPPASGPSPSGQRLADPSSESRTSSALRVPPTTATASNNPRDADSHRMAKAFPGQSTPSATITAVQRNSSPRNEPSREESLASVVKLEPPELSNFAVPARAPVLAGSPAFPPPPIVKNLPRSEFALNRTLKAHSGWVTGLAFSPDGGRLASGGWDHHVKFWDMPSGQELGAVVGKIKEVQALAFSRDGRWLAAEDSGNAVTLWDAASGREVHTLAGDKSFNLFDRSWVYSIAFSPDGRWLASALDDKIVRLWDVNTGRPVRDFKGDRRSVIYIAFSPDGHLLASGADDRSIEIWDVVSGQKIRRLEGHKKNVNAVAFSPDGSRLASASVDKTLKLWDITTGHELHTLSGHRNSVTSLAFSPDGRLLASGSWDNTVKVWDTVTGRETQTLTGNAHHVYAVAFDRAAQWLASGSEDGTILLWRVSQSAESSDNKEHSQPQ